MYRTSRVQEESLQGQPIALRALGDARKKAEASAAKTRSIINQLEQYISMYKGSYPDSPSLVHIPVGSSDIDASHAAQPSAATDAGTHAGSTENSSPAGLTPDDSRIQLMLSAGGLILGGTPPSKEDVPGKCDPPLHDGVAQANFVPRIDAGDLADSSVEIPPAFYTGMERDAGSNGSVHRSNSREASIVRQRRI
jgi:hypothetical protein